MCLLEIISWKETFMRLFHSFKRYNSSTDARTGCKVNVQVIMHVTNHADSDCNSSWKISEKRMFQLCICECIGFESKSETWEKLFCVWRRFWEKSWYFRDWWRKISRWSAFCVKMYWHNCWKYPAKGRVNEPFCKSALSALNCLRRLFFYVEERRQSPCNFC